MVAQSRGSCNTDCQSSSHASIAKEVRKLRETLQLSQGLFAKVLNVSINTVRKWEQDERHRPHACYRSHRRTQSLFWVSQRRVAWSS